MTAYAIFVGKCGSWPWPAGLLTENRGFPFCPLFSRPTEPSLSLSLSSLAEKCGGHVLSEEDELRDRKRVSSAGWRDGRLLISAARQLAAAAARPVHPCHQIMPDLQAVQLSKISTEKGDSLYYGVPINFRDKRPLQEKGPF